VFAVSLHPRAPLRAQQYEGSNPAAAAAASFASGYKAVEAAQLSNLRALELSKGKLSLDMTQLQVSVVCCP